MQYSPHFFVDGRPLLVPDGDMSHSFEDLDSENTGRDESGFMHRFVVRQKVGKWFFSYLALSDAEYDYLLGLFNGKATFTFTYPRAGSSDTLAQCTAYMSNYSIVWRDAKRKAWRNLKFNIIEC